MPSAPWYAWLVVVAVFGLALGAGIHVNVTKGAYPNGVARCPCVRGVSHFSDQQIRLPPILRYSKDWVGRR